MYDKQDTEEKQKESAFKSAIMKLSIVSASHNRNHHDLPFDFKSTSSGTIMPMALEIDKGAPRQALHRAVDIRGVYTSAVVKCLCISSVGYSPDSLGQLRYVLVADFRLPLLHNDVRPETTSSSLLNRTCERYQTCYFHIITTHR